LGGAEEIARFDNYASPNNLVWHDGTLYLNGLARDSSLNGTNAESDQGGPMTKYSEGGFWMQADGDNLLYALADKLYSVPFSGGPAQLVADGGTSMVGDVYNGDTFVYAADSDFYYWTSSTTGNHGYSVWANPRSGGPSVNMGYVDPAQVVGVKSSSTFSLTPAGQEIILASVRGYAWAIDKDFLHWRSLASSPSANARSVRHEANLGTVAIRNAGSDRRPDATPESEQRPESLTWGPTINLFSQREGTLLLRTRSVSLYSCATPDSTAPSLTLTNSISLSTFPASVDSHSHTLSVANVARAEPTPHESAGPGRPSPSILLTRRQRTAMSSGVHVNHSSILSWFLLLLVATASVPTLINRALKLAVLCLARRSPSSPTQATDMVPYKVAIHIAISNESPDVVLNTLRSVAGLDYPDYIVMVLDNNTVDSRCWKAVAACCETLPNFFFWHVENLQGFKAGALTLLLERTPPDVAIIAVIDADAAVDPRFLSAALPSFSDPTVAIVQTRLGFSHDPQQHSFLRWVHLVDQYFLRLYMPAADRCMVAPFIGGMGLLRRSALAQVGGWCGDYLAEDTELSARLFAAGFRSRYIDWAFGRSLPPSDLSNFRKQHRRWNFGNVQILRNRAGWILKGNFEGLAARLLYLACPGIYINLYLLPFSFAAGSIAGADLLGRRLPMVSATGLLIDVVLGLELVGELLMFIALGRAYNATWANRLRNYVAWWALMPTNALSSLRALLGGAMSFEITAKGDRTRQRPASRIMEATLFSFLAASTLGSVIARPSTHAAITTALVILTALAGAVFVMPLRGDFTGGRLDDGVQGPATRDSPPHTADADGPTGTQT
jgi:cellulose synthase/poly-beta-1,6-N-acetylglucosamine synthase-like glycosyltransferase